MKKYIIECGFYSYVKRFRTMIEAIEFRKTLCPYRVWTIREIK